MTAAGHPAKRASQRPATMEEAGLAPASIPVLRHARTELLAAVADGATHLEPILHEVEQALIEAIARRRRQGTP